MWAPDQEHSNYEDEKAADALSVAWGFKRVYTKKQLESKRKQEQRIKKFNKKLKEKK
jgi:hypothetical protein